MDEALKTIDLTLRTTCESADASQFPPPPPTMQAVCRAVAETLGLNGRFYVAPVTIRWQLESREEQSNNLA